MKLKEYNVIASAVRLDEIPAEYRKLRVLGRGATTLAFELNDQEVILFTRDVIKREWIRDGLRLSKHEQVVNPVKYHHIRGMRDLPLYKITMPKLYPLNAANKRQVTQEIRDFVKYSQEFRLKEPSHWPNSIVRMIALYHEEHPHSPVLSLLEWLMNYDPGQFRWDMGARQFKQTASGELVLLDPVVSTELMDLFVDHLKRKR
jgi:hypothetical protein